MFRELGKEVQSVYEVISEKALTGKMCKYIIDYVETDEFTWLQGPLDAAPWDRIELNPDYMKANHLAGAMRSSNSEYDDLYEELIPVLESYNEAFGFHIAGVRDIQIHKFEVGHQRPAATDLFLKAPKTEHRKLVVYIDLNADFEGGKVFIKRGAQVTPIEPSVGKGVVIPSYQLYGVEPVTKGTSYKLAIWGCGERFR